MKFKTNLIKSIESNERKVVILGTVALLILVVAVVILVKTNQSSNAHDGDINHNNNQSSPGLNENANNENIGTKINPFNFVAVPQLDGYSGSCEISILIDRDRLIRAVIGDEPNDDNWDEYSEWLRNYYVCDEAIDNIVITYSKNYSLKNGDSVDVYITVPESLADKIGNASKTYTVSGLQVIDYIEIFNDLQIVYDGVSGQAFAKVERLASSELLSSCRFEITPNGNLSNGDQITVSITNKDWLTELFNVAPQTLSKTFTVEGLSSYISSVEQLPLEEVRQMAQQFYGETKNELANDAYFTYDNVKYDGTFLYISKGSSTFGYKNVLRISVTYDMYMHGSYVRTDTVHLDFANIVINTSGTVFLSYEDGSSIWFDKSDYKETRVD